MTEPGIYVAVKHLITYIAAPVLAILAWFARRLHRRVDELEQKIVEIDKHQAVQEAQMQDIKQDIRNIDKKLDKIIDAIHK